MGYVNFFLYFNESTADVKVAPGTAKLIQLLSWLAEIVHTMLYWLILAIHDGHGVA